MDVDEGGWRKRLVCGRRCLPESARNRIGVIAEQETAGGGGAHAKEGTTVDQAGIHEVLPRPGMSSYCSAGEPREGKLSELPSARPFLLRATRAARCCLAPACG